MIAAAIARAKTDNYLEKGESDSILTILSNQVVKEAEKGNASIDLKFDKESLPLTVKRVIESLKKNGYTVRKESNKYIVAW